MDVPDLLLRRLPAALSALLLLGAPLAHAQATFSLEVQATEAYMGEPFTVRLTVENFQQLQPPDFPALDGCRVTSRGSSSNSSIQVINGRMNRRETRTFEYQLTPERAGELVIPPITIHVDGRTLRTQSRRIEVRDAKEQPTVARSEDGAPLLMADVTCSETRLFVGQQARFTLKVWIKPAQAYGQQIDAVSMYNLLANRRTGFGPFPEPDRYERVRLPLEDGARATYYEYTMQADLILSRPGPPDFNNLTISMDYPLEFGRSVFRELTIRDAKRLRIRPRILVPDVEPLPTKGRPANFSGAVGDFKLHVSADKTTVRVGDPIEITIEITGDGPLETLAAPDLSAQHELVTGFRVPAERLAGQYENGHRIFTQLIRAKSTEVDRIPPIEFAYFSPRSGAYEIARSEPIPLTVRASEKLSAQELVDAPPGVQAADEVTALDGLRGIKTDEAALLSSVAPVTLTQVAAAALAPPAAFGSIWLISAFVGSRTSDPTRRRRRRALSAATQRIRRAADLPPTERTSAIEAAFTTYLADRLGRPPAYFTGRSALEEVQRRDLDAVTLDDCKALVERCEQAAYGARIGAASASERSSASDEVDLADLARRCLSRLERTRL